MDLIHECSAGHGLDALNATYHTATAIDWESAMRPMLRTVAYAITGATVSVALCSHGAELSPTRPVRFIMPFAAGASADVAGRAIANQLAKMWKQQVIVD